MSYPVLFWPTNINRLYFFQDGGALVWLSDFNVDKFKIDECGLGPHIVPIGFSIYLTYFYIRMCFVEDDENKFPYY